METAQQQSPTAARTAVRPGRPVHAVHTPQHTDRQSREWRTQTVLYNRQAHNLNLTPNTRSRYRPAHAHSCAVIAAAGQAAQDSSAHKDAHASRAEVCTGYLVNRSALCCVPHPVRVGSHAWTAAARGAPKPCLRERAVVDGDAAANSCTVRRWHTPRKPAQPPAVSQDAGTGRA